MRASRWGIAAMMAASFRRDLAPDIVAELVAGVFHISNENSRRMIAAGRFVILPLDAGDFLLAPGAENRERNYALHRDRTGAPCLHGAEVLHKTV